MAIMHPKDLNYHNPTYSEHRMFNILKNALDDRIHVFYSVSWIEGKNGLRKDMSEADFVIVDPKYGYLVIEVKGGKGIRIDGAKWYLLEGNNEERLLTKSPYEQAEMNMRYFEKYYREQYNFPFEGVYGAVVAFPLFSIDNPKSISNRDAVLTIDYDGLANINERITKAFLFWKGSRRTYFTKEQYQNFIKLMQKRIAISASAGALIEKREAQLNVINGVQDSYIHLLSNYTQFMIEGGAGTGKTWIAMKMAVKNAEMGKKVLLVCYSQYLAKFIISNISNLTNKFIDVFDINSLFFSKNNNKSEKDIANHENFLDKIDFSTIPKYDTILVDEAQDFNEEMAFAIRLLLKSQTKSNLVVFFDKYQNLYERDFGMAFDINYPVFLLNKNLRNTANIYKYAQTITNLGKDVVTNMVTGPEPEYKEFRNFHKLLTYLEMILIELIDKEYVPENYVTILVDAKTQKHIKQINHIGKYLLDWSHQNHSNSIDIYSVSNFKGMESNVIIYIHHKKNKHKFNYVAYTRAKYYLYELVHEMR